MTLPQIKGAILEELISYLLVKVGYRVIKARQEGTREGKSGLEVRGRGEWHQIDALAAFDYTPPFMYPIRLLFEAKAYDLTRTVQIPVVRNAVGVLKDISENYFTFQSATRGSEELKYQRFNYQYAVFSTSRYSLGAQRYAIAHQIFLIQYTRVQLFRPIVDGLRELGEGGFDPDALLNSDVGTRSREYIRSMLNNSNSLPNSPFSDEGLRIVREKLVGPISTIEGSYFGMLQGMWPLHLLSARQIPPGLFRTTDTVQCEVRGLNAQSWYFAPRGVGDTSEDYFRLEFDLPDEIAQLVQAAGDDLRQVADVKLANFSYISINGLIGGVRRQVRLELDTNWLENFVSQRSRDDANITPPSN